MCINIKKYIELEVKPRLSFSFYFNENRVNVNLIFTASAQIDTIIVLIPIYVEDNNFSYMQKMYNWRDQCVCIGQLEN